MPPSVKVSLDKVMCAGTQSISDALMQIGQGMTYGESVSFAAAFGSARAGCTGPSGAPVNSIWFAPNDHEVEYLDSLDELEELMLATGKYRWGRERSDPYF